jgi:hypothetical protein
MNQYVSIDSCHSLSVSKQFDKLIWYLARQPDCFYTENKKLDKRYCPKFGYPLPPDNPIVLHEVCFACIASWCRGPQGSIANAFTVDIGNRAYVVSCR